MPFSSSDSITLAASVYHLNVNMNISDFDVALCLQDIYWTINDTTKVPVAKYMERVISTYNKRIGTSHGLVPYIFLYKKVRSVSNTIVALYSPGKHYAPTAQI